MIRLAVVVATALYRQALCHLLRADSRYDVVGEFNADTAEATSVSALSPDVLLLDSDTPDGPGFCQQVHAVSPTTRIILLGVGSELSAVVHWLEAGVDGFVAQDEPVESLMTVIAVAARGDFVCPRKLVGPLVGYYVRLGLRPPPQPITRREAQIVALLERGVSNKAIAHHLGIEVATTKNHVHNVLEKLGIHRRSEVAAVLRRQAIDLRINDGGYSDLPNAPR